MIPSSEVSRNEVAPIDQSERIVALDSLRGVAVLGILLMNIQGFGLPGLQIFDVSVLKETNLNYFSWYVFGPGVLEGTIRAIFSMLFGAGVITFIGILEKRKKDLTPLVFFFRRQFWLLLFGLFNVYGLLWPGDILFNYSIVGLLLFPFRKLKPGYLFMIAGICLVFITARENLELYTQKSVVTKGEKISAIDTTRSRLNDEQKDILAAMRRIKERSIPEEKIKEINSEIAAVRGNYSELSHARNEMAAYGKTSGLYYYGVGFGMFGKLQRYELYYVVAAVWIIQITRSNLWLRHFRFGPLEWLWRSLTYWKKQPMKRKEAG